MDRLTLPPNARAAMVLTHGAGSSADAPLLVALGEALAAERWAVQRLNLAYREKRPSGPPHPAGAAADRESLAAAVRELARQTGLPVFAGGHSYGGRQATMLAAEQPELVRGLLVLSYPLHPPKQPEKLRVEHLPRLTTPSLFVSGTRDDFGTPEELRAALGTRALVLIDGQGHSLAPKCAARIAGEWVQFSGRLV